MMEHDCKGMTLGDHSAERCTICGADLTKATYQELLDSIQRVRELHKSYQPDLLSPNHLMCEECSGINYGGHPYLFVKYPCSTIKALYVVEDGR